MASCVRDCRLYPSMGADRQETAGNDQSKPRPQAAAWGLGLIPARSLDGGRQHQRGGMCGDAIRVDRTGQPCQPSVNVHALRRGQRLVFLVSRTHGLTTQWSPLCDTPIKITINGSCH